MPPHTKRCIKEDGTKGQSKDNRGQNVWSQEQKQITKVNKYIAAVEQTVKSGGDRKARKAEEEVKKEREARKEAEGKKQRWQNYLRL